MGDRTFDAVFQHIKNELEAYDYLDAPQGYEHTTEHGEGPFQEYATYVLDKSDRRPSANEIGVANRCDELVEDIRRDFDDVQFVKTIYGTRITLEVYTHHNPEDDE